MSPSLHSTRGVFQCTARLFVVSFIMLSWGAVLLHTPPRGVLHHTAQLFLGFLLHTTPEESFSVPLGSFWSPSSHSPGGVLHHPSLGGCSLSDSFGFFVTWGFFGVPYHVALEVSFSIRVFWEHFPVWLFQKLPPYGSFWGVSPHGFFSWFLQCVVYTGELIGVVLEQCFTTWLFWNTSVPGFYWCASTPSPFVAIQCLAVWSTSVRVFFEALHLPVVFSAVFTDDAECLEWGSPSIQQGSQPCRHRE